MKILIVEDEQPAAEKLERYLQRYDPDFEVLDILKSVETSVNWFQENPSSADLVFMDRPDRTRTTHG